MNKKGFVTTHAFLLLFVGLIIGLGLAYYLAMKGFIPF